MIIDTRLPGASNPLRILALNRTCPRKPKCRNYCRSWSSSLQAHSCGVPRQIKQRSIIPWGFQTRPSLTPRVQTRAEHDAARRMNNSYPNAERPRGVCGASARDKPRGIRLVSSKESPSSCDRHSLLGKREKCTLTTDRIPHYRHHVIITIASIRAQTGLRIVDATMR